MFVLINKFIIEWITNFALNLVIITTIVLIIIRLVSSLLENPPQKYITQVWSNLTSKIYHISKNSI